jgi:hypothetical protein
MDWYRNLAELSLCVASNEKDVPAFPQIDLLRISNQLADKTFRPEQKGALGDASERVFTPSLACFFCGAT